MLNPKYFIKINSLVNYANTSDNYGNGPKLCFYQKTIATASFDGTKSYFASTNTNLATITILIIAVVALIASITIVIVVRRRK